MLEKNRVWCEEKVDPFLGAELYDREQKNLDLWVGRGLSRDNGGECKHLGAGRDWADSVGHGGGHEAKAQQKVC